MPKCERCKCSVSNTELAPMPHAINVLACSTCRETAPHLKQGRKPRPIRPAKKEDRMPENKDKQLISFSVSEVCRKDDTKDIRFDLNVAHSGLAVKFGCTMDEVREFLAKRKAAKEEKLAAQG